MGRMIKDNTLFGNVDYVPINFCEWLAEQVDNNY